MFFHRKGRAPKGFLQGSGQRFFKFCARNSPDFYDIQGNQDNQALKNRTANLTRWRYGDYMLEFWFKLCRVIVIDRTL